jgi:hypothetical protein
MYAAVKKTPDLTGAVEVLPAGKYGGAPEFDPPSKHCIGNPSIGHVISAVVMEPSELADYCRKNPIFTPKITPPETASYADRAMFWAVFRSIKEDDRGALYAKGGYKLINETVLLAMEKLKDAQTPGERVYTPEEEYARAKADAEKYAAAMAEAHVDAPLLEKIEGISWKDEMKKMAEESKAMKAAEDDIAKVMDPE